VGLPSNVKRIKVHPAIGFARFSTIDEQGEDYFFVYGQPPSEYKANGVMKRQAVQFRLFAYDDQNRGIEELDPSRLDALGVDVVWRVSLANRKIARNAANPAEVITADGSSDRNDGRLVAKLTTFDEGNIELGRIMPNGLFIPPRAGVFRRDRNAVIPIDAPLQTADFADNTSDGLVAVVLTDRATRRTVSVPVLGAWVVVCPQDYSPDVNDDEPGLFPRPKKTLEQWLVGKLGLPNNPPATPVNQTARELDRAALRPATSDFAPGIELHPLNLPGGGTFKTRLYPSAETSDPDEVRVKPKPAGGGDGADPGELSSGLCSPWQFDFILCTCGFWAAQRPDTAFKDDVSNDLVRWLRRVAADVAGTQGQLATPQDIIDHVDQLGVVRKRSARQVETERTQDIP
jgi:hypothetical protein